MEFFILLYGLYGIINPALAEFNGLAGAQRLSMTYVGIAAGFFVLVYVFRALALSKMAKRAGKQKLVWCAFVPFASTYLMGELAGTVRIGSLKIKKIGMIVMIGELLYTVSLIMVCVPLIVAFSDYGRYFTPTSDGMELMFTGLSDVLYYMYRLGSILVWIFEIIFIVVSVPLYIGIYRCYAPASYIWLTILCVVFPVSAFILFAFRNRNRIDYDAFMRARTEAIRRQQQMYYGNPYNNNPYNNNPYNNNPYNNPYGGDPYNNPYGAPPQPPKEPDDPFGEFPDGGKGPGDDPFGFGSNNPDNSDDKGDGGQS